MEKEESLTAKTREPDGSATRANALCRLARIARHHFTLPIPGVRYQAVLFVRLCVLCAASARSAGI